MDIEQLEQKLNTFLDMRLKQSLWNRDFVTLGNLMLEYGPELLAVAKRASYLEKLLYRAEEELTHYVKHYDEDGNDMESRALLKAIRES